LPALASYSEQRFYAHVTSGFSQSPPGCQHTRTIAFASLRGPGAVLTARHGDVALESVGTGEHGHVVLSIVDHRDVFRESWFTTKLARHFGWRTERQRAAVQSVTRSVHEELAACVHPLAAWQRTDSRLNWAMSQDEGSNLDKHTRDSTASALFRSCRCK